MPYQSQDASTLCKIASAANGTFPPAVPAGWTLGTQLPATGYSSGIQAFFCSGTLPSAPSVTVYAMAIGFDRSVFIPWYAPTLEWLAPLPANIIGAGTTTTARLAAEEALGPVLEAAARIAPVPVPEGDFDPYGEGMGPIFESRLAAGEALARALDAFALRVENSDSLDAVAASVHRAFGPFAGQWRSLSRSWRQHRDAAAVAGLTAAYNRRAADVPLLLPTMAATLTAGVVGSPNVDFGFLTAYQQIRNALWSAVTVAAAKPFYVLGHNVGAPPAQLAAIDFRPGRSNPASPVGSLQAYYYGQIAVGDADFASTSASLVPAAYAIQYAEDYVPQEPQAAYGYVLTGQQIAVTGSHGDDPYDSPWWQQSGDLYCDLLDDQAAFLNTSTPVAAMSRGDLHLFTRGAHDEVRHRRCTRYFHDSRTWYAWRDLGRIAPGVLPAAASLGGGRIALAVPLPLGGTGVRLFDGYWHPWRVSPQTVASLAIAGGDPEAVHLAGIGEDGTAIHWRVNARSGEATRPAGIPNPFGAGLQRIGLAFSRGALLALLHGPEDELQTAVFEGDAWRTPARPTETSGPSAHDDVRLGVLTRGIAQFLALSADRRTVVTEQAGGDGGALLAAPAAVAVDDDAVEGLAFGVTADLRLVENRRVDGAWRGWSVLPFGRFEDPVAGVIRDHSQQKLDEIARRAGLI